MEPPPARKRKRRGRPRRCFASHPTALLVHGHGALCHLTCPACAVCRLACTHRPQLQRGEEDRRWSESCSGVQSQPASNPADQSNRAPPAAARAPQVPTAPSTPLARASDRADGGGGGGRGTRRPAKVGRRRRRAGDRASEVADGDDAPGAAGESGNAAAADSRAQAEEEEESDERYLNRVWFSQMLDSASLMWVKAWLFTRRTAWLSEARREAGAGGEHHHQLLLATRLYESVSALSLVVEAAIMTVLCLFQLTLIPAGRARVALRLLMAVSFLAASLMAFAVVAFMEDSKEAAALFLTVLPSAVVAVQFAQEKLEKFLP